MAVVAAVIVVIGVVLISLLLAGGGSASDSATTEELTAEPSPPLVESLQDLAATAGATPAAEDAAPDFSVPTLIGEGFTLSDHLATDGRPVILNLWASWCFPCREEMPTFDAFQIAHPEVAVVGVAVQDDQVAAEEFAVEIGVGYTIGFDEKDVVNTEYSPLGLPATFWISEDRQIVKRLFGLVTDESLEADLSFFSE